MTRREFMATSGMAAAGFAMPAAAAPSPEIQAVLLHMGMNMWGDWLAPGEERSADVRYTRDEVFFDESVWRKTVDHANRTGCNMILMDIGEFVRYPSHPELAVKGSWAPERLNAEVRRIRSLGMEPVPKLNFASPHDSWLKEYHRMLGTSTYYRVVEGLVRDVAEIFEHPRFMHIGWDEESWKYQKNFPYAIVRQRELWWHDFLWNCDVVRKCGMQPWVFVGAWLDDDYVRRCPKDVVQTNAYYDMFNFGFDSERVEQLANQNGKDGAYERRKLQLTLDLDKAGFKQIPMLSEWLSDFRRRKGLLDGEATALRYAAFNRKFVSSENLMGFVWASWTDCKQEQKMADNMRGLDSLAKAMRQKATDFR